MVPSDSTKVTSAAAPGTIFARPDANSAEVLSSVITAKSITNQFIETLCYLGACTRQYLNRGKRSLYYYLGSARNSMKEAAAQAASRVKGYFFGFSRDVTDLFRRTSYHHRKVKTRLLATKGDGPLTRLSIGASFTQDYSKVAGFFLRRLSSYILPVLSILLFLTVFQFFASLNYGVEVTLNGESLGFVRNEAVYEKAEKTMQERIYYENNDVLYTTPSFRLAVVNDSEFQNSEVLSNKIIMAVSDEINEAYGLYVNGSFVGATTDKDAVSAAINGVLDRYRTGAEGERVNFLQTVQLKSGLYLNDSIMSASEMVGLVTADTEASESYTVKEKDTISGIANRLDMSSAELLAMNPGVNEKTIRPGQSLVVKVSKPYFDVSRTSIISYEDVLPFEELQEEVSSQYRGWTKSKQKGKNGKAVYKAEVTVENGMETKREVLSREVVENPVNQIVQIGTKELPPAGKSGTVSSGGGQGTGSMQWPVKSSRKITCNYLGYRGHTGIDLQSFAGDDNLAADNGQVVKVQYGRSGYGYHIIIDHGGGIQTLYAHNSAILVVPGQYVTKGQTIAKQGRTGNATGVHLHFEVRKNGSPVNPYPYIKGT